MTTSYDPVAALARLVVTAAHGAFIDSRRLGNTDAECTCRAVEEALRCAVGNRLVTLVPEDRWSGYVVVTPPYELGRSS